MNVNKENGKTQVVDFSVMALMHESVYLGNCKLHTIIMGLPEIKLSC
jgi:hypothetical protein